MLKSKLYDSGDEAPDTDTNNTNRQVIFKNYFPFCSPCSQLSKMSKIDNTQLDNARYLHIVIPMCDYSLQYSNNYSETSESSQQYCRGETYHNDASDSESFKFK